MIKKCLFERRFRRLTFRRKIKQLTKESRPKIHRHKKKKKPREKKGKPTFFSRNRWTSAFREQQSERKTRENEAQRENLFDHWRHHRFWSLDHRIRKEKSTKISADLFDHRHRWKHDDRSLNDSIRFCFSLGNVISLSFFLLIVRRKRPSKTFSVASKFFH